MVVTLRSPSIGQIRVRLDEVDALSGIAGLAELLERLQPYPESLAACPFCGCTEEKYLESGYVGCAVCYSALPSLRAITDNALGLRSPESS